MAEQNTGWRDISTVPYDEVVLFYTHDGNIVQDFMYDCGTKQMAGVYTHWQPLLPPPGEEGDSELTIRSISGGECIAGYAVVRGDELVDTFDSRKDAELVVRVGGDKDVVRLVERRDALQARCYKLEAAAREACDQLKSLAYASHKATGRPLSKRPRTKMLQRPEKVRDNLLAVRKTLRTVVDGGE